VWNQSITRTRWLAVKLGLVGLAAITAAGLASFAVAWWSDPIDKASVAAAQGTRMEPLLFLARGIVPIGYAAFALALGVTVGMLVSRTLPAMAITLAVFVALQIAMPQLVRPHLVPPTRSNVEITTSNLDDFLMPQDDRIQVRATGDDAGAWVLSSHTVDASGHAVDTIPISTSSGPCAPPERPATQAPPGAGPGDELSPCLAELTRLGYRQQVTYQPSSRFWTLQWYETGIYTALALGLTGFCFWRLRHRLS
jgi:hypothetical protein